ncbi:MAG: 3-isopropylmalate dehydratase small subunit [Spirochaetes bacterium]|nr:MAG: 3-isopropylmalate dehydratase small subunit [Spirochaetota bacterium]
MKANNESVRNIIEERGLPLPGDDIDTDRIIPARYLKAVTFDKLGDFAFYDERFDKDGKELKHPFNDKRYKGAGILIVNKNFGCGSSREHAPQSLMRAGIKAIIGESFAEIFLGNCTALGIPAVTLEEKPVNEIMSIVKENPETILTINLDKKTLSIKNDNGAGGKEYRIGISNSARQVFLSGTWDTTSVLLSNENEIREKAAELPYLNNFSV